MNTYKTIQQVKDDVSLSVCTVYYQSMLYFVDIDKDGFFIIKCNQNPMQELLTDNHNPSDFFNTKAPEVDLFETPEVLPDLVQHMLNAFNEKENSYENCKELLEALQSLGYTFEYGLDAIPFELREMTAQEKTEYNEKQQF